MTYAPTCPGPRRILAPWDGVIPFNLLESIAQSVGGEDVTLLVQPVSPEASEPISSARACSTAASATIAYLNGQSAEFPVSAQVAEHEVDLILMATRCRPAGAIDPSCMAAQLALDSPIPVMVVHVADDPTTTMQPLGRVLLPLDGSARSRQILPLAADLAHRLGVPVKLLMVLDPRQVLPPGYVHDPDAAQEMIASLRHDAHWALTQAEQSLMEKRIDVEAELLYGPVVPSLGGAIQPGDVVVMTTHGAGDAPHDQLGSVAARLLAEISSPLVIMRSHMPDDAVGRASPVCACGAQA